MLHDSNKTKNKKIKKITTTIHDLSLFKKSACVKKSDLHLKKTQNPFFILRKIQIYI